MSENDLVGFLSSQSDLIFENHLSNKAYFLELLLFMKQSSVRDECGRVLGEMILWIDDHPKSFDLGFDLIFNDDLLNFIDAKQKKELEERFIESCLPKKLIDQIKTNDFDGFEKSASLLRFASSAGFHFLNEFSGSCSLTEASTFQKWLSASPHLQSVFQKCIPSSSNEKIGHYGVFWHYFYASSHAFGTKDGSSPVGNQGKTVEIGSDLIKRFFFNNNSSVISQLSKTKKGRQALFETLMNSNGPEAFLFFKFDQHHGLSIFNALSWDKDRVMKWRDENGLTLLHHALFFFSRGAQFDQNLTTALGLCPEWIECKNRAGQKFLDLFESSEQKAKVARRNIQKETREIYQEASSEKSLGKKRRM